ncbi:MAG: hypothetical protein AB8B93_18370 [Pseudomonadales bacterium]
MRTATIQPGKQASRFSFRPLLVGFYTLVLCCAGVLISDDAQARVDGGDQVVKLHLPVNLEGRQTLRLNRLVDEYYDIDLDNYVLREVVLETDGANDRRDAFASLQVGRYRTGRVGLHNNLTSLEAPVVHSSQWRLQLGSGVRAHGILLVLSERNYNDYRTHPHQGASLGLGWFIGDRDYYFHDRYARPSFFNRYHRDHLGHYRGTWHGNYRLRYRNNLARRQWLLEQQRLEQRQRRALKRERNRERQRDEHRDRARDRDVDQRQWRGNERQAHQRQQRPDRTRQQRVTTARANRDIPRAQPRVRSNRDTPRTQPRVRSNRDQRPRSSEPRRAATRTAAPRRPDRSARAKVERPRSARPQQRRSRAAGGGANNNRSKRVRM